MVALVAMGVGTVCAGYFGGFETGLYTLDRIRLRHRRERGEASAAVLSGIVARPRRAIATALVGHNLSVYLVTALVTRLAEGVWPGRAELLSVLVLALPLFLVAEVIPKEVMRRAADVWLYRLAYGFRLAERVLWPATTALSGVTRLLGWLLGPRAEAPQWRGPARLRYYLGLGYRTGLLSAEQTRMAENILRVGRRRVAQAMVPLSEVEALDEETSEEEARERLRGFRHRRVLLVRGGRENVVGAVARLEVLLAQGGSWRERLRRVRRPVLRVGAQTTALEALDRMRRQKVPLAVVEDERGRVVGLVTTGDLVEEIVGELGRVETASEEAGGRG